MRRVGTDDGADRGGVQALEPGYNDSERGILWRVWGASIVDTNPRNVDMML